MEKVPTLESAVVPGGCLLLWAEQGDMGDRSRYLRAGSWVPSALSALLAQLEASSSVTFSVLLYDPGLALIRITRFVRGSQACDGTCACAVHSAANIDRSSVILVDDLFLGDTVVVSGADFSCFRWVRRLYP